MHRSPVPLTRAALPALAALLVAAVPAPAQTDPGDLRVSALADSAALIGAVTALQVPRLPQGTLPVFAVDYDRTGAVTEVKPAFGGVPDAYAGPVTAALRAHLKPQPGLQRPFSTYLWVAVGEPAQLRRPRMTPPELLDRGWLGRELRRATSRHLEQLAGRGSEYLVQVWFRVGADGAPEPGTATVIGSSQEAVLDSEVLALVGSMRFRPARLEDRPVPAWVVLPVALTLPADAAAPLSALVDSAALARAVAALPAPRLHRGVPPVFQVTFLRDGPVVAPLSPQLPAGWAGPVADAIRANLDPRADERADEFYLRVTPGRHVAVVRACRRPESGKWTRCATPADR
ncbi:MAG TPA: energy transducer TonB [Longimicrobiaceae bacterium]